MKNEPLFIDTGAFYARYVSRDDFHQEAVALWEKIRKNPPHPCLTTNFVLSEFITLLAYRFDAKSALQAAKEIYASHSIQIISISREVEIKALDWLEQFADHRLSMTDVTSFVVMEEQKIRTVFTFDNDFKIAGFQEFQ